jgi:site-specific DNA-methyltransferase (cytosine-N4-specific)
MCAIMGMGLNSIEKFMDKIICGDCRAIMKEMPSESIDFVMFSPPYYGLRNYGENTESEWGGKEDCSHEWIENKMTLVHENRNFIKGSQEEVHGAKPTTYIKKYDDKIAKFCAKCGCWKGQLGLEPSWKMYVEHMVDVCREVKRVLKNSGSMYIVLGDTYAGSGCGSGDKTLFQNYRRKYIAEQMYNFKSPSRYAIGYQPKCLMGIPWRVAFALIEDKWILRNAIVWHKPNAMPSSVKDRLAQTYELIFHFVKNRKYYYNLDAIRLPHKTNFAPFNLRVRDVKQGKGGISAFGPLKASEEEVENYIYPEKLVKHDLAVNRIGNFTYTDPLHTKAYNAKGKNPGDTWAIDDFSYGLKLVYDRMEEIDASYDSKYKIQEYGQTLQSFTREENLAKMRKVSRDVAKELFPNDKRLQQDFINWVHDHAGHIKGKNPGDVIVPKWWGVDKYGEYHGHAIKDYASAKAQNPSEVKRRIIESFKRMPKGRNPGDFWSITTKPFKGLHFAVYPLEIVIRPILSSCPENGIVLDPMCGSGTTCLVAKKLGRHFIGIDINEDYCQIARKRLSEIPERLDKFAKG